MIENPVFQEDEKNLDNTIESDDVNTDEAKVEGNEASAEVNPYKEQMAKLAVENRQKAGALKEAKSKAKELEDRLAALEAAKEDDKEEVKPTRKYLSPEEAEKLMEDKMKAQRLEDLILQSTSNVDEQNLVRYHLNNSIVKTGDIQKDLTMAIAIANSHLVNQAKSAEVERTSRENMNAQYSMGRSYHKPGTPSWQADPIKKEANELLKKLGIKDGEKYL